MVNYFTVIKLQSLGSRFNDSQLQHVAGDYRKDNFRRDQSNWKTTCIEGHEQRLDNRFMTAGLMLVTLQVVVR